MSTLRPRRIERELLLDVRPHALEQPAGSAVARILERGVRAPARVVAVEHDVAEHALDVDDRHALADPLLVHHASAGCAHTLKLYGIMKYLAMPSPNTP